MNRHSIPGYFVPFNVMPYSTEKCHHWAIVTSLNPCTPTPLRPDDVIFLFLDFVIILDDVNPWAIVTSLNPCTPTPLRPHEVIFLFLVYTPTTPLRPDDVIFSVYRLLPSTLHPDDVIIFDDVIYLI